MTPRATRLAVLLIAWSAAHAQQKTSGPLPIIDMHLHALPASNFGPPPIATCARDAVFLPWDARDSIRIENVVGCPKLIHSARSDDELMTRTLALMKQYNVIGVASGPMALVRKWKAAAPDRIIPGVISNGGLSLDSIRAWVGNGSLSVLGEMTFEYAGLAPADTISERYYALAEQLDIPIGVHVGPGPPGGTYLGTPRYRARLSNPLQFEDVLVRHPKLRLYIMHAGWPMADEMIALLYAYPQVYVDVAVLDWFMPRANFDAYLKRLVEAGFGKRIMFGSDQMVWPDALPIAIDAIQSAKYLTPEQKRDILYNNAARFLRLDKASAVPTTHP